MSAIPSQPLPIFGDWICTPVTETNRERLMELTGMTPQRLKDQEWLPLRREGNGTGTRYFLYKSDLIAALEKLPRD